MHPLESSFALLSGRAQELADRFYANLFAQNPVLRPMFPKDLSDQKQKLIASLILIVKNLRSADKLLTPLHEMGERHETYGAQEAHYGVVRQVLTGVMADMAGPAWNEQLAQDWQSAIDMVASIMLEGYRGAPIRTSSAAERAKS